MKGLEEQLREQDVRLDLEVARQVQFQDQRDEMVERLEGMIQEKVELQNKFLDLEVQTRTPRQPPKSQYADNSDSSDEEEGVWFICEYHDENGHCFKKFDTSEVRN